MPWASSLARPDSVSQSVVQAGASTVVMRAGAMPAAASAASMSWAMTVMAGQPE